MVTNPRKESYKKLEVTTCAGLTWTRLEVACHLLRHAVVEPQFMKSGVPVIGIIKQMKMNYFPPTSHDRVLMDFLS